MDYLFGVKTKDFVILAADKTVFQSIYILSGEQEKHWSLGEQTSMLCVGDGGDAEQFSEYIEKNVQLYKMRNGYELGPKATGCFVRRAIAESLRTRDPYLVFLILGGYDVKDNCAYLSHMDYLGTQFEGNYLMHGHGSRFCYSILDRIYRSDWTEADAIEGMKKCFNEVKTRFILNMPKFMAVIIDKNGMRRLDDIVV